MKYLITFLVSLILSTTAIAHGTHEVYNYPPKIARPHYPLPYTGQYEVYRYPYYDYYRSPYYYQRHHRSGFGIQFYYGEYRGHGGGLYLDSYGNIRGRIYLDRHHRH